MRERIQESPCEEVLSYLFRPACQSDLQLSYQNIIKVNQAHVVMLAEQGIIEKETAKKILAVNDEISAMQEHPLFKINLDKEDLYFNMEQYLIDRTSLHIGGQQHTARSRNDMLATIARLNTRKAYFQLGDLFLKLRKCIVEKAKENLDAYMSGYTHLQPSEPTTFAAWLSAIGFALERDYKRFAHVYEELNACPLGGCAVASTSFPINRERTAELMGFDKLIASSIDCVASRDYALELVGALSTMALTLSRMAQDLYVWATPDFDYVEVGGCTAACSSIMPQKKNPITLEHIKAKAAHLEGFYVSIYSSMKNVVYTHCRDISAESIRFLFTALQEAEADMALTIPTIDTLNVKKEVMYEKASKNFCTVTELANQLVRYGNYSFRAAHEIVGNIVVEMMDEGKDACDIDLAEVDKVCQKLFGRNSGLTEAEIRQALDPKENVMAKHYEGGSAPEEVTRQLSLLESAILADEKVLTAQKEKAAQADQKLREAIDHL